MKRHASDSWVRSGQVRRSNAHDPTRRDELVINRNRLKDLNDWIDRAVASPRVCLLLLCGPAGCGKTISVRVLAAEKGVEILDWTTPVDSYNSWDDSEWTKPISIAMKFKHFLLGAGRYSSVLDRKMVSPSNRKLIIVKDIPTSFLSSPNEFTEIIDFYVAHGRTPVVFICTDSAKKKSKDIAYELFSEDFKVKHNTFQLAFLPIPVTSVVKALKRTALLSRSSISDELIQEIALESHGDIRKAINDLNILSVDASKSKYKSVVNKRVRKGQGDKKKGASKDSDKETTGLFHSVGRVLYAKRETPNDSGQKSSLDPRGELIHKPLEIAGDFSHYSNQFVSLAHSNYLDIFSSVDCITRAAEYLSDSDIIMSEWREKELLRTVGFTVAVGGLMEANVNPIRQWKPLKGSPWNEDLKMAKANYVCVENAFSDYSVSKRDVILDLIPFITQMWRSRNNKMDSIKWCSNGFLPHHVEELVPVMRKIRSEVLFCFPLPVQDINNYEENDSSIHISDDSD